jgi:hypothetical protein
VEHGLPAEWSFWQRNDREMVARCDDVVVLMLEGWEESVGVREEVRIAREMGKPVRYLARELVRVSPTFAHVASGLPDADQTPNGADLPPTLAHVGLEVPG